MSSKLPTRYVSEEAIKRALKIESFRNISKDKIMQFVSMIPYTDKEVAIAIINQFPIYAEFGKIAVSGYMQMCNNILEKNNESQRATIQGYQVILEALSNRMSAENLTGEECKALTEDMIIVADKIAKADLENKKFLEKMGTKLLWGVLGVAALVGTGIGINSVIGGGDIPQLPDDEENEKIV